FGGDRYFLRLLSSAPRRAARSDQCAPIRMSLEITEVMGRTGSPQRNGDTEPLGRGSTGRPASQAERVNRSDCENERHRIVGRSFSRSDLFARIALRCPSNLCRSVQPPLLRCSVVKPFAPLSLFLFSPSSLFRCAAAAVAAVAVLSC